MEVAIQEHLRVRQVVAEVVLDFLLELTLPLAAVLVLRELLVVQVVEEAAVEVLLHLVVDLVEVVVVLHVVNV